MGTVATFAVAYTDPTDKKWVYRGRVSFNTFGHYCGYITIPANHGVFQIIKHNNYDTLGGMFDAHGGITYSEPNSDGSWELGFDCAHSCDYRAGMDDFTFIFNYSKASPDISLSGAHRFRTRTFVLQQLESLAQQIHKVQCEFIASQPS